MYKNSQILPRFPWVEFTSKDGRHVGICEAIASKGARLYHISDKTPDGLQILDEPKWYVEFKHARGQTQSIELDKEQAEEISEHCSAKIETFEDGLFWF